MLPDYAEITARVREVCDVLDHRTLNDIEGLANPTTELLALWLVERIRPGIEALGGELVQLVVDEGGHKAAWRP
jgi:6-pyruvoyltetrahydropterin/6-carboxytetrahydropterin synthase